MTIYKLRFTYQQTLKSQITNYNWQPWLTDAMPNDSGCRLRLIVSIDNNIQYIVYKSTICQTQLKDWRWSDYNGWTDTQNEPIQEEIKEVIACCVSIFELRIKIINYNHSGQYNSGWWMDKKDVLTIPSYNTIGSFEVRSVACRLTKYIWIDGYGW